MVISPSDRRLTYCGRIDFDNPDAPVMVYASSYVTFKFTGNFLKVRLTNKRSCWSNRMGCIVDGVQTAVLLHEDDAEHEYTVFEKELSGVAKTDTSAVDGVNNYDSADDCGIWHEVIFFKRQDSADYVTIHGFEIEDGAELAVNEAERAKKLKLEVYGDSVSCGRGFRGG